MCWQAKNKIKFHWRLHLVVARKFRRPFALLGSLKRMLAGRNCITHAIETPAGGIRVADNWSLPSGWSIVDWDAAKECGSLFYRRSLSLSLSLSLKKQHPPCNFAKPMTSLPVRMLIHHADRRRAQGDCYIHRCRCPRVLVPCSLRITCQIRLSTDNERPMAIPTSDSDK
jgi:hypothetical protein